MEEQEKQGTKLDPEDPLYRELADMDERTTRNFCKY